MRARRTAPSIGRLTASGAEPALSAVPPPSASIRARISARAERRGRSRPTIRVAKRVRMLRDHGQSQKSYHDLEGYNGRLDAIQAAFLRIKLRHLDDWNAGRRAAALVYNELLSNDRRHPYSVRTTFEQSRLPFVRRRDGDRDALATHLNANRSQPGFTTRSPFICRTATPRGGARGASRSLRRLPGILSLPMFPACRPTLNPGSSVGQELRGVGTGRS